MEGLTGIQDLNLSLYSSRSDPPPPNSSSKPPLGCGSRAGNMGVEPGKRYQIDYVTIVG